MIRPRWISSCYEALSSFLLITPWLLVAAPGTDSTVTFNRDIAPIIFNNCASCHRPGEGTPFPLTSYEEVKKRGQFIATVTENRYMPPWHAAQADVEYRDERRLSDEQIARIQSWVKQSMPEVDANDLPPLPGFVQGWQLGEPDLVLEMPEPYHVPADGPDIYRAFAIPLDISEDKWVRAIEYRPKAQGSSHHAIFFLDPTGEALKADKAEAVAGFVGLAMSVQFNEWAGAHFDTSGTAGGGNSLGAWVVGSLPRVLPDGMAYRLPKGSTFVVQSHFHPSGKPEVEQARVGLHFVDKRPEPTLTGIAVPPAQGRYAGIRIPAGDKNYTLRTSFTTPIDIDVYGAGGHAHYLGKDMKLTAVLPDGVSKTLLLIDRWDFSWQDRYFFREPLPLPAGTRLEVVITYDNSAENPNNPFDPPRRVIWGAGSENEMGSMSIEVAARREEELPLLEAAKIASLRQRGSLTQESGEGKEKSSPTLERYDKDGDGKLSPEERKALFRDLLEKRRQKTAQPSPKDN